MGFAECNIIMQSRTGSVSSGLESNCGGRGPTLKSSPFCPRSSSKLTQSIIKDHMVSHYKKVYSAKAAIDASVPKSLLYSVKYNDQIRQEQLRKGGRPQSAQSLSQRNSRSSSAQSRLSVQYDDSPYLCSRSSMASSPRFSTSFHAKEIAYPSRKISSHPTRSASEMKYRSPEAALQRKQSACSLGALADQTSFKSFQDPVQKTYSGDLLQKHSQHFTQDKPFTPKTLKSDKSSYLSKYRYYRAPPRKPTQDGSSARLPRQNTYHGSTKNKESTQDSDEPSQEFNTEHEWSEDEFNGTYSSSRQQSRATKSKEHYFFESSLRFSPEGGKSPKMKRVSAEEEEIRYLEFISAVTEDILARGHISDRVIDRVIKRHIDMNRHRLDEGKMRHLLEVLRKEFEEPATLSTSTEELEKQESDLLDSLLPHLSSGGREAKNKRENDLFPYVSLIKCVSPNSEDPLMVSTTIVSPGTMTPNETNENDEKEDNEDQQTSSPLLNEVNNTRASEEDFHQTETPTTDSVNNEVLEDTNETSDQNQADFQLVESSKEEVEDLGRSLSESLHVSNNTNCENEETAIGNSNLATSLSDDEF